MMKKIVPIIAFILAGYLSFAQDCGTFIDLIGTGTDGQTEVSLTIGDLDNVEKIVLEAIHKSENDPPEITFSTSLPFSQGVNATEVQYSGWTKEEVEPVTANYYRLEVEPAGEVSITIPEANKEDIFSFSAYVYRKSPDTHTVTTGELFHVFQNEGDELVINIPLPASEQSRDITVRFGITELNDDTRSAIFRLMAGDDTEEIILYSWDEVNGEKESFTIQEVVFEDVPSSVTMIEMTMLSQLPAEGVEGDSFIGGVVLTDLPCEYREYPAYCTYTQGFYGNEGGKTCQGETTVELLLRLLEEPLVLGGGDNRLTIGAGDAECILRLLPGGGPSQVLDGPSDCNDLGTITTNKQGRIRNALLAQGLTLALNLRNSPDLNDFPLDGEAFLTMKVHDCSAEVATGIQGTEYGYTFQQGIVDHFNGAGTIGDLLQLVNDALAGEEIGTLSLSQVAGAANLVNEAFDECVVVIQDIVDSELSDESGSGDGSGEEGEGRKKSVSGLSKGDGLSAKIYPNPVRDRFYIKLPERVSRIHSAGIYSISGRLVQILDLANDPGAGEEIEVDGRRLRPGIYILRIHTDAGVINERFGSR